MSVECTPQVYTDVSVDPFVRGFLHRPTKPNGHGLVLTHGAGANCAAPLLVAIAGTFCDSGFLVLRCDLPFRQDRPYGPPGPYDGNRDRAGLRNAFLAVKNLVTGSAFLAGHSYGGRQASMLCAEMPEDDLVRVAGLLLLSYPLHPPQKPAQLRTQHFFNLRTSALFVHGAKDPFATTDEMPQALKLIPARTKLLTIEGAGHDLGFKGKARRKDLPAAVLAEFQEFFFP